MKNSLRVLASTQDLLCASKTARAPPQKGASTYKDCSRVLKVEPTVATRKETLAQPRREEPVVTMAPDKLGLTLAGECSDVSYITPDKSGLNLGEKGLDVSYMVPDES